MGEIKDIPKHWEVKQLEDLLTYYIGGDWGKDEFYNDDNYSLAFCIRGSEIKDWKENKGITASKRKIKKSNIEKRKLQEGDLLVEISGGGPEQPVGRTVLIDKSVLSFKPEIPKICTNFLRLIRPTNKINPVFLNWFLTLFYNSGEIGKYQAGSNNLRNLKFPDYLKINIPVPPITEQQAIVAKIEELFSELDHSKQQLVTAQQQLKVYRQSLLKWAFEGRLTHQNVKEGELPEGWKIVKLSDLGSWKGGGTPSKLVNKYWENGTNLWVTSKDMKIGVINDSIDKITDEAILNSSAKRIPKGAILFVMRSGILRHTFPVAIAGKDLTVNQDLQTLSPNGSASSEFIYWFIRAFNNEIRQKCSKDGTTVESIESNLLKNYPFILPSHPEQQLIVSELESKLTVCDKIEETISQSLLQVEALRQSILKKAFEGKLV